MKWVKCIYNGDYSDIKLGKVYEVLDFIEEVSIFGVLRYRVGIINELGMKDYWLISDKGNCWFEDATDEVRDKKLNEILD